MSTIVVYTSPAAGHVFPLMPGLIELERRGHEVHVVTGPHLVDTVRAAGIKAEPLDQRIIDTHVADYELPGGPNRLRLALAQMMRRGPYEADDLRRAIAETGADVVLVDTNAFGAAVAAAVSGLPWATTLPSLLPLPERGVPPYGIGMKPRRGPIGAVRDAVLWKVVERSYGKAMLPPLNDLRAASGLPALRNPFDQLLSPDRLIVLAGAPLEYPRGSLPPSVRMVGAQLWDPPGMVPAWLDEPGDPWVLVTCSTEYQADELLARTAIDALAGERLRVIVTLADAFDTAGLQPAANVRIERFVPHTPVLERAVAVICPSGMGIVAKAVAHSVPVVAVPFGRDQPEVARRVVEAGAGVTIRKRQLDPERLRTAVRRALAMSDSMPPAADASGNATRFADAVAELC